MKGIGCVGVVILAACMTPAFSAERPYITPVNYPTPVSPGSSLSGVITNIDPVNRMIQVRQDSGMVQTIHLDEHIQLERNGQPAKLNTLSLGDSVTVTAN
jgi:hypothetical protein